MEPEHAAVIRGLQDAGDMIMMEIPRAQWEPRNLLPADVDWDPYAFIRCEKDGIRENAWYVAVKIQALHEKLIF